MLFEIVLALALLVSAILYRKKETPGFLCFCGQGDDADMKIAPAGGIFDSLSTDSGEQSALEYIRERENGNMARAHDLGRFLASQVLEEKGVYSLGFSETESVLMGRHRRILFTFVVDRALDECCPTPLLAQAALNVFYDEIQKKLPGFYEEMNESGAFSLYLLSARGENPGAYIGADFAALCQVPQSAAIVEMAEHLFDYFLQYCKDALEKAGFVH